MSHPWCGNLSGPEKHGKRAASKLRSIARTRHHGHKGLKRLKSGRLYCPQCEGLRRQTKEYKEYQNSWRQQRRGEAPKKFDVLLGAIESGLSGEFTTRELADALSLSVNTVRCWVRRGWLDTTTEKNETGTGFWRTRTLVSL